MMAYNDYSQALLRSQQTSDNAVDAYTSEYGWSDIVYINQLYSMSNTQAQQLYAIYVNGMKAKGCTPTGASPALMPMLSQ